MVTSSLMKLDGYLVYIILILILLYLYRKINVIIFYGKYVLHHLFIVFIALGCIPVFALNARNLKNLLYVSHFVKYITYFVGIRWELRDMEYVSESGGAVIVANHQSIFDILGMHHYWHYMGKCAPIAKKELLYFWPFGLAAWLGGVVFIDRSSGSRSYDVLFKTAQIMQTDKTKIYIFPEGTRNHNANRTLKLLPFKKGAFRIAISCKVPILPIVYSPYYFIDFASYKFGSGKMIVKGLPPISTENLTENDVDSLMEKTREVMNKAFQELSAEVAAFLPDGHFTREALQTNDKSL